MVVTCERASSASLSTCLQLTGGDTVSKEPVRYAPGNSRCMAPKDLGFEAAPPGAALPRMPTPDISIPMTPRGALSMPRTSVSNATDTAGSRWMTGASNVRLLRFNPMLPSKPGI
jgi:hypothetical protein